MKGGSNTERIEWDKALNVPNLLTVLRMAMLPLIVWRFLIKDSLGALILYLLAMLTDAADGIIARRFHQITALGKLLDPLADKLTLLTLTGLFVADGQIPLWLLLVLLGKEAILIAGGAVALRRGIVVYALPIGKATTVCFILSMAARFLSFRQAADALLTLALALSMIALAWYAMTLWGRIKPHHAV